VDDAEQAYQDFIKRYELSFPTYRDTTKQIPLMYGTTMYPDTYIIDRGGKLDRKIVGAQDWSSPEMTQYLNHLLGAK
jgi:peroxiredoxin